jgi:polar amino acid transport system substrate-binding protein
LTTVWITTGFVALAACGDSTPPCTSTPSVATGNTLCTIESDPGLAAVEPQIHSPTAEVLAQLAPTGRLRVGTINGSALLGTIDANGNPSGTSVDFGCRLAARLGVPVDFVGTHKGTLGSTFDGQAPMVADTNAGVFDVGVGIEPIINTVNPPALLGNDTVGAEVTFLVPVASSYNSVKDLPDDSSISIGVTSGTAIEQEIRKRYTHAVITTAASPAAAMNLVKAGTVTATANGRAAESNFVAASWPGQGKVLPDTLFVEALAPFVASTAPLAQCYLKDFVESARTSGLLQLIIDRTGPPATRVGRVVPAAEATCSPVPACQ